MLISGLLSFLVAVAADEPWLKPGAKIDFGGAKPIRPESWFIPGDYTSDFERKGEKGEVVFAFEIDQDGYAKHCQPVISSGHARLDAWTCKVFVARARFKPARDEQGSPTSTKGWARTVWKSAR